MDQEYSLVDVECENTTSRSVSVERSQREVSVQFPDSFAVVSSLPTKFSELYLQERLPRQFHEIVWF